MTETFVGQSETEWTWRLTLY